MREVVTPAKAGVQEVNLRPYWIPAFAGMTGMLGLVVPDKIAKDSVLAGYDRNQSSMVSANASA